MKGRITMGYISITTDGSDTFLINKAASDAKHTVLSAYSLKTNMSGQAILAEAEALKFAVENDGIYDVGRLTGDIRVISGKSNYVDFFIKLDGQRFIKVSVDRKELINALVELAEK